MAGGWWLDVSHDDGKMEGWKEGPSCASALVPFEPFGVQAQRRDPHCLSDLRQGVTYLPKLFEYGISVYEL